jgi:transforming growth factor-beta-induced protein
MKRSLQAQPLRAVTLLLLAFLFACVSAPIQAKPAKMRDIADTVAANPILTQYAKMIQGSGLGTFLSSRGPFTVFVPTDSAFSKLPPGMFETLLLPGNQVRLQDILLFHVVNGKRFTAKDLLLQKSVLSCEGDPPTPLLLRTSHSGTQFVMKAKIVSSDIRCQNGIIDEIDTVLMPPDASLPPLAEPPVPAPVVTPLTNAPPPVVGDNTNAPAADTNAGPVTPVAPTAAPVLSPH